MNLIYTVGGGKRGRWVLLFGFLGNGEEGGERVDVFGLDGVLGWVGLARKRERRRSSAR